MKALLIKCKNYPCSLLYNGHNRSVDIQFSIQINPLDMHTQYPRSLQSMRHAFYFILGNWRFRPLCAANANAT